MRGRRPIPPIVRTKAQRRAEMIVEYTVQLRNDEDNGVVLVRCETVPSDDLPLSVSSGEYDTLESAQIDLGVTLRGQGLSGIMRRKR